MTAEPLPRTPRTPRTQQARPRRTQEERSALTRGRLLDATIACLVDYGYVGTTLGKVAERAMVTRGAQVHHFATKETLVIEALRHLNALRATRTDEWLASLDADGDWTESLLELLWETHRGPVFVATAEMWLAGRTNPSLAAHIGEVEEVIEAHVANASRSSRLEAVPPSELRDAVYSAMDAMRGLAISTWHLPDAEVEARWHRLRRTLRKTFPTTT